MLKLVYWIKSKDAWVANGLKLIIQRKYFPPVLFPLDRIQVPRYMYIIRVNTESTSVFNMGKLVKVIEIGLLGGKWCSLIRESSLLRLSLSLLLSWSLYKGSCRIQLLWKVCFSFFVYIWIFEKISWMLIQIDVYVTERIGKRKCDVIFGAK